jgi:hypothetical protein
MGAGSYNCCLIDVSALTPHLRETLGLGSGVARYRAFVMAEGGRVVRRYDFVSSDDAAALEHARQHVEHCDIEVWQLHRLVGVLRPTTKVARASR